MPVHTKIIGVKVEELVRSRVQLFLPMYLYCHGIPAPRAPENRKLIHFIYSSLLLVDHFHGFLETLEGGNVACARKTFQGFSND